VNEGKREPVLALELSRSVELPLGIIDTDHASALPGQPGRQVGGAAAELDDVEPPHRGQGLELPLRDPPDPPGQAVLGPAAPARLDELGRHFNVELLHEDVDSVSGLVLTLLGRIPEVGDSVRYGRLQFEVTKVKGHGVDEAAVSLVP